MSDWHGYVGIEDLGLTAGQRATLIQGLRALGRRDNDAQPCMRMQYRERADGLAAIFEATFDGQQLTVNALRQRLATLFGVNISTITNTNSQQSFAGGTTNVILLKYNAANKLRVALFGGVDATWEQSGAECNGYLIANIAAWGSGR